jgi:hypothetical protein
MIVDWKSNCQIPSTKFDQVPLIIKLVNTFVVLFLYLSFDMVWLLLKKKQVIVIGHGIMAGNIARQMPQFAKIANR